MRNFAIFILAIIGIAVIEIGTMWHESRFVDITIPVNNTHTIIGSIFETVASKGE